MRHKKITIVLGIILFSVARLSAAAPQHVSLVSTYSDHPYVLIGDSNGGNGGSGANSNGGNGGNSNSSGSDNGNDSGDDNGTGNGSGDSNGSGDGA